MKKLILVPFLMVVMIATCFGQFAKIGKNLTAVRAAQSEIYAYPSQVTEEFQLQYGWKIVFREGSIHFFNPQEQKHIRFEFDENIGWKPTGGLSLIPKVGERKMVKLLKEAIKILKLKRKILNEARTLYFFTYPVWKFYSLYKEDLKKKGIRISGGEDAFIVIDGNNFCKVLEGGEYYFEELGYNTERTSLKRMKYEKEAMKQMTRKIRKAKEDTW